MKIGWLLSVLFGYFVQIKDVVDAGPAIKLHDGGNIRSPTEVLSQKYMKNEDQTWDLDRPIGYWALVFQSMAIETSSQCEHDYLEIRESEKGRRPVRYCGEVTPQPYLSESPKLAVRFVTDDIWELAGFNITVIYAQTKDLLEYKVNQTRKQTATLGLQSDDVENKDNQDPNRVFYILVGSSTGALVVFAVLLTYFITVMRKQSLTHETRVPTLYYTSGSGNGDESCHASFVRLKSGQNSLKSIESAEAMCLSGKRRYLKDKKSLTQKQFAETFPKQSRNQPGSREQHNNMYVSSLTVAERLGLRTNSSQMVKTSTKPEGRLADSKSRTN